MIRFALLATTFTLFTTLAACATDDPGAASRYVCSPAAGDCGDDPLVAEASSILSRAGVDMARIETLELSVDAGGASEELEPAATHRAGVTCTTSGSHTACCAWDLDGGWAECWWE
ncbi:MAG: hypothetical protein F9K40_22775 [Kofleriaceae bacterium]|nr:MAG: hypothetical protein F9K40_22775 [Kofleriaceae bacterium]MBZ0233336.1 hypothetical protein [Kofleriaceae bacterium]